MACNSMKISSPSMAAATKDTFREHKSFHRSFSGNDLYNGGRMRRSYSDNHICYSINRVRASSTEPKLKNSRSMGIFPFQFSGSILPNSLKSFLFDPETSKEMDTVENSDSDEIVDENVEKKRSNWIERLLEIRSHWRNREQGEDDGGDGDVVSEGDGHGHDEGGCEVDYEDKDEGSVMYDRESFSKMLSKVTWPDIKLFSQLAFLSNMAYVIPEIKAKDLRKRYRLRFVTSSLEKKAEVAALKAQLEQDSVRVPLLPSAATQSISEKSTVESGNKCSGRTSAAYEIAASAASYVQSQVEDLQYRGSEPQQVNEDMESGENKHCPREDEGSSPRVHKSEVAAYVATSTITSIVAAGEKAKQQAAKDLQSLHSSPCEWFVCDDYSTYTRCFIIQGSDSVSSWQANLFFDPTKFEGTEVLVHRGIYEAAKGIYEQFMPEIKDHLNTFGDRAKFQFTGHSLGGSLSLLVNLMLLARKVVKPSALRPVVTFGSPFVFCGGQKILEELGLDENHVHCVMMHRDIVPRAFSCNYPNRIAQFLKRVSGSFRSHPCLNKNKLLYSPMGKIFILQPDEKSSPPHPFLPLKNALFALEKSQCRSATRSALRAFLNFPHPLDTLSDPTAYGSEGTILRDHDSSNYLKAMNGVLRQNTKATFQERTNQRSLLLPLLTSASTDTWSYQNNLENSRLLSQEVTTGV